MAGEVPLLDYATPIFIGLKSAHTDRFFYRRQIVGRKGQIFIGPKVSAHEPIFAPIFCLRWKIGPCALGIRNHNMAIYCSLTRSIDTGQSAYEIHVKSHHNEQRHRYFEVNKICCVNKKPWRRRWIFLKQKIRIIRSLVCSICSDICVCNIHHFAVPVFQVLAMGISLYTEIDTDWDFFYQCCLCNSFSTNQGHTKHIE